MEMQTTEKMDFDFSDMYWGDGYLDKLLGPYLSKVCAEAFQNTLANGPPDLSFGGGNVEEGLTAYLQIPGLSESVEWKISLDNLVLEVTSHWCDEDRCEIASALRALADRVEAQTVKA